jgi:hypothetical protein
MNNSESNQPSELKVNPTNLAESPAEFANILMTWAKSKKDPQTGMVGHGHQQSPANRVFVESVACSPTIIRD